MISSKALLAALAFWAAGSQSTNEIVVSPAGPVRTLTDALARARPGDRIVVRAGTYREPTLLVRTPRLTIEGEGWPVLDGGGTHEVLIVAADDVTVRGFVLTRTGISNMEDRAGIRVRDARRCVIENNRLRDNLFGIYLERSTDCVVRDNEISTHAASETSNGNGIHLWYSPRSRIERNRITGQRDGIYLEFSPHGVTRGNVSRNSQRYGLHFMFSDSCLYEGNSFIESGAGVAVMYSHGVVVRNNRFEHARGGAAYGLLMKEILGGAIMGNVFTQNSVGLYLEGATHLEVRDNDFLQNGWAARVQGDAEENHFSGNRFAGNGFDVATNARTATSTFDANWWDEYRGYDLNRDGVGDVPFHPVSFFALVVERHPSALLLLRSPLVSVLDMAERVFPVLTPAAFVDLHPLMRSPR